jgi:hypothetical protein
VIVPAGGHFLPRTAPRVFLHHVQPFLSEVTTMAEAPASVG